MTGTKVTTLALVLTTHTPGVRRTAIQLTPVSSVPRTTGTLVWSRARPMDTLPRTEWEATVTVFPVPRAALLPSHSCGHHLHLPLLLHGCLISGADGWIAGQVRAASVGLGSFDLC